MKCWEDGIKSFAVDNKYTNWYIGIISSAKKRTLVDSFEVHHIVPRSLGGGETDDNLVKLTIREHLVCHALLCKMTVGQSKYKMLHAVNILYKKDDCNLSSRVISSLRQQRRELMCGSGNPNFGKKHNSYTRYQIGTAMRGKTHTAEAKEMMSFAQLGSKNHMFGRLHNDVSLNLMREKQKDNRSLKVFCPHCSKELDKQNFKRWHGDKCKQYLGQT